MKSIMTGVSKRVEIQNGMMTTREETMTFVWRHPKYYKEIKKQNNLTNNKNYDKGIDNENIQSKNSSLPTRTERNTSIRSRTKPRTT